LPEQKEAIEQGKCSPPPPNWRCLNCGHEDYLMCMDEQRAQCPKCGSKNVEDLHLKKIMD